MAHLRRRKALQGPSQRQTSGGIQTFRIAVQPVTLFAARLPGSLLASRQSVVLLQAIISLISRSAGRIFSAMFGWAVSALFGRTTPRERKVLSVVVGAAAVWPILLLGVIAPKVATLLVAFVPVARSAPSGPLRIVWIALALLFPILVGIVFVRRAPPHTRADSGPFKFLRGFQITLGLAGAFLFVLVAAPIQKLISTARGLMDEYIPLIVEPQDYQETARRIESVLVEHGFPLRRWNPSWVMKAPGAIMGAVGGSAFRHFMPQQIDLYLAKDLEVVLSPSGVTLRGKESTTSRAHGLIAEAITGTSALQSMDARAQVVEREIKDVWKVYAARPEDHLESAILRERVAEISREIANLTVPYEEWQIVYRQALQLSRALHGQEQLLEKHVFKEVPVKTTNETRTAIGTVPSHPESLQDVPLRDLLSGITDRVKLLATKEVALAKAEIRSDVKSEIAMAKSLGIAAVCGLLGLNMLLVAAAFALATMVPGWAAALIVAAPFIVVGIAMGAIGWTRRVTKPLEATRASLKEDLEWTRNRLA